MLRATQPAILFNCHDSGMAVATVPTEICPTLHCQIASEDVETISDAFMNVSMIEYADIIRA